MESQRGVWTDAGAEQGAGGVFQATSPIDGETIAIISLASDDQYERAVSGAQRTFQAWRQVPAPERGQLVREIADELRRRKRELGLLITNEVGKILPEGEGEIQEAIDIADFAVGLSRQLYGLSMHSERREHRMYEQWHPLGVVGVITAFNFPAAVWAWNAFIAAVCGDTVVWKPSERGLATAVAMNELCGAVATRWGFPGLFSLVSDVDARHGRRMANDPRIALVSATGSVAAAVDQGATLVVGGKRSLGRASSLYVEPTILRVDRPIPMMKEETFAPILYVCPVADCAEAIAIQNDVPQGLSSAIFTNCLPAAERFLSSAGSDWGIANVNIGTSGAEIGGAFGGEKDTGGGRKSGSDSWKQYMRRQTTTINYGTALPLAQGIVFGGG